MVTKRERDTFSNDHGSTSCTVTTTRKIAVPSRESSYYMESGREDINEERGAPSTLQKRRRVEGLWFSFLETLGLERKWDPKGPSTGTYGDIVVSLTRTDDRLISFISFQNYVLGSCIMSPIRLPVCLTRV